MPNESSVLDQQGTSASKPIWQSKTMIGIVIMLAVQLAGLAGFQFTPDDIATLTSQTEQMIGAGVTLFGAALAIYGRIKATKRIGGNGGA
jgi:hypothetical protein